MCTVHGHIQVLDAQRNKSEYTELLSLGPSAEQLESNSSPPGISVQQSISERRVSDASIAKRRHPCRASASKTPSRQHGPDSGWVQDGSLEAVLQIHCKDVEGLFLRRAIADCAYFCRLLQDEAEQCWPPAHQQPKMPLHGDVTKCLCTVKVLSRTPVP